MPIIDPSVEEPARQMLGHAIRGDFAELAAAIRAGGGARYRQVLGAVPGHGGVYRCRRQRPVTHRR
jgi:hypothetical protein